MVARRSSGSLEEGCIGCFILLVLVLALLGFVWSFFDDTANAPEPKPKPEKPKLETATMYVTGDDGGAFGVSSVVWTSEGKVGKKMRESGVVESNPSEYHLDLSGFESDGNESRPSKEDITIVANKTEPWEGDLSVLLEVNEEIVACETMREVSASESYHKASILFDADEPEDYESDFICRLYLWFY